MFVPKETLNESANINIAPLMDVMTIILIFLLVNFSVQDSSFEAPKELHLPISSSLSPPRDALYLVMSKKELHVGNNLVAHLSGDQFWQEEENDDGIILPLLSFLKLEAKKGEGELGGTSIDDLKRRPIFFQADESLPFGLLGQVMRTSAQAGFRYIHLAVFNPDS